MELTEKEKMAAKAFARMGGLKGGKARAEALTPKERHESARQAAEARWAKQKGLQSTDSLPQADHFGVIQPGGLSIPCAVLRDETRVLTRIGFLKAIGRRGKAKGGRQYDNEFQTPVFLSADNLKPFISDELERNSTPILFIQNNIQVIGYRAELLAQVCKVFLDAERAGVLKANQYHIAEACRILYDGFATIGIIGLIDEATGYQDVRARNALAKILEQFIAKELQPYASTFPLDFFKEMCRLRGIPFPSNMKIPRYFGKLINNLTYCRLAPGVLEELQRKNPPGANGRRKNKNYRWLTEHIGYQKLLMLLGSELTLMRDSKNWKDFEARVDEHHPRYRPLPRFESRKSTTHQLLPVDGSLWMNSMGS